MSGPCILTGAYGSGKTEIALALALEAAAQGPVTLIDLDFVTPYFRSQDVQQELSAHGVRLLAPEAHLAQIDAPVLPEGLEAALCQPVEPTIVDIGGDPAGAVVIAQFVPRMPAYECWVVVNFSRPTTATPALAEALLAEIAVTARLRFSGLISNTHLGPYTTADDVLAGLAQARGLAAQLGVPVVRVAAPAGLALPPLPEPLLPITPRLRRPWE